MAVTIVLLLLFLPFVPLAFSGFSPNGAPPMSDAAALLRLKESFTNSSALSTWSNATSPCDQNSTWYGVVCEGNLTGLRLAGLGLSGNIDIDALLQFDGLRSISFDNNSFSGPLPAFERLTALKSIFLSNNQFSGALPDNFFVHLNHLKKLWLDGNQITGAIPSSLGNATSLIELHMARNKFGGSLPSITPPPSLSLLNVSYNDLEGTIPAGFNKFNSSSFEGNPYLCSTQNADKPCQKHQMTPDTSKNIISVCIVVMIVIALLVAAVQAVKTDTESSSYTLGVERDLPYNKVQSPTKVGGSPRRNSFSVTLWSKRSVSSVHSVPKEDYTGGISTGDLVIVNQSKGAFGMLDLMKAAAEVLGSGGIGSVYKAALTNGVVVAVKRVKDMNRVAKEVFDMEMSRFGRLRHPNILPLLAYNFRKDEKLLVSEFIPKGSLLYVLHGDRGMDHAALDWPTRALIARGIARGMVHLHTNLSSLDLPHGNLKSGNILLAPDFQPLLVDFGFCPLLSPSAAQQAMLGFQSPEHLLSGQPVSKKSDVYCFGIVLLELLSGKFPSQYLQNGKGGTDLIVWANHAISEAREAEFFDPSFLEKSKPSLPDMKRLLHIAVDCVEPDVEKRPDMKEATSRIEVVVADVERVKKNNGSSGEPAVNSHAAYVRDGANDQPTRRSGSINDRLSRGSDNAQVFSIS
ncbi:Leucine-rich repeat protein kinase family protein [Rhynchospora pubera]|uniref:Leucine-rich repeat protein kinase family protein n=1 Tax=Rhynchospora pubera TaxID=906938 RepID=A0AAV8CJR6_9POAL|nr:Leucine-rich repeat protein kinase family protein [Rhynchospora pubera]